MDIILVVLLIILFLSCYSILYIYFPKNKKWVYVTIGSINIVLIALLALFYRKQHFNNNNQKVGSNKRQKLMKLCGLPENEYSTSHCFADSTHQTCCMLGPVARREADLSGNPIGKASKLAFIKKNKRNPTDNDKTPWCTCLGSKVCSQYAKKYKDGTRIKFINNPRSVSEIVEEVSPDCEGNFRDKFKVGKHLTPGIDSNKSLNTSRNTGKCKKTNRHI